MPNYTPWKKSRKYGDIYGGRDNLKCADNIFNRVHSIKRPNLNDVLPILMEENPSRDFFFPLSGAEILTALRGLPSGDVMGITHIWMRRVKKSDFINGEQPLAWFCCGSGVRAIVLFPWPTDLTLPYGDKRPSNRVINEIEKYGAKLEKDTRGWVSKWTLEGVRKYYIQSILFHEVGHHIDRYYRHWSAANHKAVEEFADQYAISKTANATHVFNRLEKSN